MEGHGHNCLLPFDSDDSEFARGFEAGRIWALLRAEPEAEVQEYAHASNAEMLLRMAEALGRGVQSSELDGDWIEVTFAPVDVDTHVLEE